MIVLSGVDKYYGDRAVLKRMSLSFSAPSLTLLGGPNGAGKTTLLRLIAGLSRPDEGHIERRVEPGRIGYLGHQPILYGKLSALDNLRFWQKLHGARHDGEAACLAELDRAGLGRFAHERAGTFSRGMAQRLSLARLMVLKPALVLLDEPETGLDRAAAALLEQRMDEARNQGAVIIWITHRPEAQLPRADRLILLDKAHVAYDGPPDARVLAGNAPAQSSPAESDRLNNLSAHPPQAGSC